MEVGSGVATASLIVLAGQLVTALGVERRCRREVAQLKRRIDQLEHWPSR